MFNKKLIKNIILILLLITAITLIGLFILSRKEKIAKEEDTPEGELILDENGTIIENFNEYNTVKSCLNSLVLYVGTNNINAIQEICEGDLALQNITTDSIVMLDPVHRINNEVGSVCFVSFKIYKQTDFYYAVIILDHGNKTYKIIPSSKTEYKEALNKNIDNKYKEYIKIEQKKYNKFKSSIISEEDIIKEYFNDYIQKALYYPQEAYANLNAEYRQKRFGSFTKYQEYLQYNREKLESLDVYSIKDSEDFATDEEYEKYMYSFSLKGLSKYQVQKENNHTVYTCIDDYGSYYKFKINGAMDYEVYLDDYTIETSEFIKKYNSATAEEKVVFNINKVLRATDSGDFDYAYSKLHEDFKKNYIKTVDIFKVYAKNNWIEYKDIEKVNVEQRNDTYVCTVKTKDNKSKQFVMKLGEGTDFAMSFSI